MGNEANPKKLTTGGTTTIGSCAVMGIGINKTLVGTIVVYESGTEIATFAATTPVGQYHTAPNGARYANLSVVLSTTDNATIFVKAI